jgi:hypothetical protein
MPYTEDRYAAPYAHTMMVQPKQTPSVLRPAPKTPSSQREALPATLTFTDPTTLLTFMSSLASPSQLLTVNTLHIVLPSSTSLARQQVGQVAMGVHLMLRYTHNLDHLYLQWADAPSSVLTGTSFRLTTFSSTLFIDGTVISFLEAQSNIRKLDLGAWGVHLPPSSSTPASYTQYPAPPMLSPTALPSLAEFTGHAEVAAQLAAGGRPLQAVNLISGLPASTSSPTVTAEWREIMGGLAGSPIGIRSLSVVGLERFNLEMLAEIGRHLHDLDYLFLRVQRPTNSTDVFRWEYWKNYILPLANLEQIDVELFDSSATSSSSRPGATVTLPSVAHIQQWHNTCPLLASVAVSTASAAQGRTAELCAWEWKNLRWVDKAARR